MFRKKRIRLIYFHKVNIYLFHFSSIWLVCIALKQHNCKIMQIIKPFYYYAVLGTKRMSLSGLYLFVFNTSNTFVESKCYYSEIMQCFTGRIWFPFCLIKNWIKNTLMGHKLSWLPNVCYRVIQVSHSQYMIYQSHLNIPTIKRCKSKKKYGNMWCNGKLTFASSFCNVLISNFLVIWTTRPF